MSNQLQVSGEAKIRSIQGPVVANSGVITALDGDASQYVRGDGTLADFPTSTGGGSSVSYYLNSSVSQGTIGGIAYRQLGKTPIAGAGTDITTSANGYIASYITDANDPALLEVPAGNFNCEFYFSVNNNTGNPYVYAEIYKYDGTTFTLLGTSVGVPEYITEGNVINPYYFAVPVATSVLTVTDRISIRIYVNVSGRTVTLHTENNHLCQVVTTFSKGLISLNNLTRQNQFFQTGTSGTDFNISSVTATHTFNIPDASATNRGLITTGTQTIAGDKTFSGSIILNGGVDMNNSLNVNSGFFIRNNVIGSTLYTSFSINKASNIETVQFLYSTGFASNLLFNDAATYSYSFPTASGTIALTSNLSSYVPYTGATTSVNLGGFGLTASSLNVTNTSTLDGNILLKKAGIAVTTSTYVSQFAASSGVGIGYSDGTGGANFILQTAAIYDYTFPAATGTLALTSNLGSYVPYTGATGAVNLGAFDLTVNSVKIGEGGGSISGNTILGAGSLNANTTGYQNTAIGYATLNLNTTGYDNTSVGYAALNLNTTGFNNTAIGSRSLFNNTTGNSNTSVGYISLTTNTTGVANTSIGYASLANNTTGFSNVAVGYNSMANSNGNENTAIGNQSMQLNTTGVSNTAIGHTALQSNTTGNNNIAIGYESGINITTGSNNTIIGKYAGTSALANNIVLADGQGNIKYRWDGTNNNLYGNVNFSSTIGNGTYTYTLPSATGTLALTSDISGYLPLTGGTLTGQLYINPTNTATVGLDVASNTIRFRSDNLEGFKRQLTIGLSSGTVINMIAQGFGANYGTDMAFYTATTSGVNGTPAMYITGTNNRVGIKTGTPAYDLDVSGTGRFTGDVLANGVTIGASDIRSSSNVLTLGGTSEVVRIVGSTGNVGIGTSSPTAIGSGYTTVGINGVNGAGLTFNINGASANSYIYTATDGFNFINVSGSFLFYNGGAERMRIENDGKVFIGTTTNNNLLIFPRTTNNVYVGNFDNDTISIATRLTSSGRLRVENLGTGLLYSNGAILTSTNPSDSRLKENITDISWGLSEILKIRPVSYYWKDDKINQGLQYGFIAQEVQEIMPDLVKEFATKDGENDVIRLGLEKEGIYATLVKAIQELSAEVEQLKAKIN